MGLIGSGSCPWKHLRTLKLGAETACRLNGFPLLLALPRHPQAGVSDE